MIGLRRSLSAQSVFVIDGDPACDFFHAAALEKFRALGQFAALVAVSCLFAVGMAMVGFAAWMWL